LNLIPVEGGAPLAYVYTWVLKFEFGAKVGGLKF